jgi:DNA-binding MarR family transcriptional regulator
MEAPPPRRLSPSDRRRTLAGLTDSARGLAVRLLSEYDGWNAAKLATLRNFVLSSARLEALQAQPNDDARAVHREARCALALLKALDLRD